MVILYFTFSDRVVVGWSEGVLGGFLSGPESHKYVAGEAFRATPRLSDALTAWAEAQGLRKLLANFFNLKPE
jgi:hypothetical protein